MWCCVCVLKGVCVCAMGVLGATSTLVKLLSRVTVRRKLRRVSPAGLSQTRGVDLALRDGEMLWQVLSHVDFLRELAS